jgi:DUF4097 and DUF4098 domain-containing protein YvlB
MRRRSFTGPLLLLVIGGLFLWRNLHPETEVFDLLASYWPFLLIAWGTLRLIEVMFWERHDNRHVFTGGEVVLIVFICIAGSGAWQARQHGVRFTNNIDFWTKQFDYPIEARASAVGAKRVVFENPRGNVKVSGGDTQEIVITGRKLVRAGSKDAADRANNSTPVEIVLQGDRLLVRTNQDRVQQSQRVSDDLEVVVPRALAVEARNRQADYEIADMTGDVELAADRGDVRLTRIGGNARLEIGRSDLIRANDMKGTVDLHGEGSDIDMENVAGKVTVNGAFRGSLDFKNLAKPLEFDSSNNTELRVQSVPGRITMDLGAFAAKDVVGPVRLVTHSRDITIEQFTGALVVETERGDIELTPGKLPMPSIDARSGTGKIDLVLPGKATFNLQATAQTGDAVNDFGPPIKKEVDGRSATLTGRVGEGPTMRLNANRGWISVRKEGSVSSLPPDAPKAPDKPKPPKGEGDEI